MNETSTPNFTPATPPNNPSGHSTPTTRPFARLFDSSSHSFAYLYGAAQADLYFGDFDAAGNHQFGDALVNVGYTPDHQAYPSITTNGAGRFLFTWQSYSEDGSGWGNAGRVVDASGNALTGQFLINQHHAGQQVHVRAAMRPDGGFLAVWNDIGRDGSAGTILGAFFNADGTPSTGEFGINQYPSGDQSLPQVVLNAQGDFFIAWNSTGQDAGTDGVYARILHANGTWTDEFRVNAHSAGTQYLGEIVVLLDGGFLVTLNDDSLFLGGSGNDTLTSFNTANLWTLTSANNGTINGTFPLSSVENHIGGTSPDTFAFLPGSSVAGNINGGGGSDTLDYSGYDSTVSVNLLSRTATGLSTFTSFATLIGSAAFDTLLGDNANRTWTLSGPDAGTVVGQAFTGFENLTGGTGNETFRFAATASVSGTITGAAAPTNSTTRPGRPA